MRAPAAKIAARARKRSTPTKAKRSAPLASLKGRPGRRPFCFHSVFCSGLTQCLSKTRNIAGNANQKRKRKPVMTSYHRPKGLSSALSYKDPKAAFRWLEEAFGFEPLMVILDNEGNL